MTHSCHIECKTEALCDSPIPLSLSAVSVSVLGEVGLEANSVAKLSNRNRLAGSWPATTEAAALASLQPEARLVAVSIVLGVIGSTCSPYIF